MIFTFHDDLNTMTLILIPAVRTASKKLVREILGDEPYEYYPVGRDVVIAPAATGEGESSIPSRSFIERISSFSFICKCDATRIRRLPAKAAEFRAVALLFF